MTNRILIGNRVIPDLHYKVTRVSSVFCRAKHALVFYRHDRNEAPFVYHVEFFAGENGVKTRAAACRRGAAIVRRQESMGWRSTFIPCDAAHAIEALNVGQPVD